MPAIEPVVVWHRWEPPLVSVFGVVPAAAIVPIFSSIVHISALQRDHHRCNRIWLVAWPLASRIRHCFDRRAYSAPSLALRSGRAYVAERVVTKQ